MKKNLLFAAAVLCTFACSKPVEEVPVVEVNLSSFGFSVEKNAALKADVFVENPSSSVSITLPYGTEEDALKNLVPTFTVTEGATVTVEESEVESGVSAVDFTYPVEFLVSVNEKSNALYTITVKIGEPDSFIPAAKTQDADSIGKGPYLAINPKTGEPYFGVVAKTEDGHPLLYRYNGASIVKVCDIAEGNSDQPTVAFTSDGTAFFACYDKTAKSMDVYKVGENSASVFGEKGVLYAPLTNSTYQTIGLLPLSATSLYTAYGVSAKVGNLAKRILNLAHTDGKTWQQEIKIAGRDESLYAYEVYSKMVGDTGYLLIFNQNKHSLSLYKFDSEISTIFEGVSFTLPSSETQAKLNLFGIDFDIASDGTPYFMTAVENSSALGYSPAIYKYDLTEKMPIMVGGVLSNIDASAKKNISFALNSNDIPYVAYTNGSLPNNALYTYIGSKTKVWVDPIALSDEKAENVKIAFAEDGIGYIAYEAAATGDHHIALYKTK